ncbi:MAG: 50S ribosomal protein L25 [candidate division WOR-3 bacterium]
MAQIKATIRNETGKSKVKKLRRAGFLPAVMYGHGDPSVLLTISAHEFGMTLRELKGHTPIVDVQIADQDTIRCVIKTIQRNPIDGSFLHVDFQKVHPDERITMNVPVVIRGVAAGVKQGGMLEVLLREIPVRATIDRFPEHIEIDVTNLRMGHSIHIADLKYEGLEFLLPPESAIVTILTPRKLAAAVEAATAPAVGAPEPEVIKEKKAAEETESEEGKGKSPEAEPESKKKPEEKKK